MKNIYIVGFMGTGKSVAGKLLAKSLNLEFFDLDSSIEEKEGRKIKEIFAEKGEAYFRKIEKQAVQEVSNKDRLVVACGGGVVLDKGNIDILKKTGRLISLTSRPEVILSRCQANCDRPLLNVKDPQDEIKKLLAIRQPFYAEAEISIDTSDLSVEEVVRQIKRRLVSND